MQIITDILSPIATTLGLTFIRSDNLAEANIDLHYDSNGDDIMIYNGQSKIETIFGGAEIIDVSENEIYFLRIKPKRELTGAELDTEYQATKLLANKAYHLVNISDGVANDVETFIIYF